MTPFAARLRSGEDFVGLGLSNQDLLRLKSGETVTIDLGSVGVGIWFKGPDDKRVFLQPRESKVVVIAGDTKEDIGEFLRIDLP